MALPAQVANFVFPLVLKQVPSRTRRRTIGASGGRLVVLSNPAHFETFRDPVLLNSTGALVYKLCDGRRSIGDIVGEMHRLHPDVPWETVVYDVIWILRALWRIGRIKYEC